MTGTLDVSVAGVGMTPFESSAEASLLSLTTTAAQRAFGDASVDPDSATSVHVGTALAEALGAQSGLGNALVSALGIEGVQADRVENTSATGASAFHRGVQAIESGASDIALVVGAEKMSAGETADVTDVISRLTHSREHVQGLTLPSFGGLAAGIYLDRYDVPRKALAEVPVRNHANAVHNPVAQFRKEISVADVLDSPNVADPLRLFDCCPMSDGAAAVVLSRDGPIQVASIGSGTGSHAVAERPDPLKIESVRLAGERTFGPTQYEPSDVDIACLHDAFSILEWLELEALGFYERGEAWKATVDGATRIDGELPVNPGGGLKARGHPLGATGLSQLIELVWQLRGDLPQQRQIAGAELGFAINIAGFGNNSVCTLLET